MLSCGFLAVLNLEELLQLGVPRGNAPQDQSSKSVEPKSRECIKGASKAGWDEGFSSANSSTVNYNLKIRPTS